MSKPRKQKGETDIAEREIYQRFMDWLKQTWWGLPETDYTLPLIRAQYTPEEASLLTGMPFSGKSLEELAEIKQKDPAELRKQLNAMARKGLVFRTVRGDSVRYRLNDFFFIGRTAFWPGRKDKLSKTLAPLHNQHYYHGGFEQHKYAQAKLLRALPIQETIDDTRQILPYEEVAKVLDSQDYFVVTICPCKHRKNLDPDFPNCEYPTEVCLHFGQLGRYIVENGMGREITRKETEDILRQCAEVGLVHAIDNQQERPDTICNCCKCCCVMLEAFHKLKHAEGMSPSNYRVRTNHDTCIGCGLCVKRCPMEALRLKDFPEAKGRMTIVAEGKELKNKTGKVSAANIDFCIGCGVCAYKCPTKSLVLERRAVIHDPPVTRRDYIMQYMSDLQAAKTQL
jgi:formate hydrogenlyase subunit 6/NADH:ubiquinone oxidoreductase subunit I